MPNILKQANHFITPKHSYKKPIIITKLQVKYKLRKCYDNP